LLLQWDKVENKTGVVLYGVGAFILLWFSSTLVSALNAIPLVGVAVTSTLAAWLNCVAHLQLPAAV
jgi:hypothetical protein